MTNASRSTDLLRLCVGVLIDKKAGDLRVLDVSAQSSITDAMVIATATSEPHLRALRVELEKKLDESGTRILGIETARESGWLVVDLFDVMVHLFLAETRVRYRLESLWKDAVPLDPLKIVSTAAKPKKRRSAKRATPGRKAATKRR